MSKTIEEKARAYDEALEKAREYWETDDDNTLDIKARGTMEYLFPELVESEGERIRKEILEVAKTVVSRDGTLYGKKYNCREWIAWLEKQVESKEYTFKSLPRLLDMIEPTSRAKAYCQKLIDTLTEEGYNTDAKIVKEVLKGWNGEDVPMAVMDEKQGEQKPSTEVKPKFHEGDWIVDNIGVAHQIEKTVLNVTNNTFGYDIVGGGYFNDDSDVHLWTIQDAKDGDVLCAKYGNDEMPFIFTGKQGDVAYCALNSFGEFVLSIAEWLLKISVLPATKEQRDILFAKMHEAGYEWDENNKMLKEIVEDEEEPQNYKNQIMSEITDLVKHYIKQKPACSEAGEDIKEALRTEYEKGRADAFAQMQQGWSDKEKQMYADIIEATKKSGVFKEAYKRELVDFLNFLKERYTWKPSDEQMKVLNEVLNFAANHENPYWNDYIFGTLNNFIRQLKN